MNRKEIWNILETRILPLVNKPGRYIGGEINQIRKNPDKASVRIAFLFPDVYEIGMSNLGLKILYEIVNKERGFYAERVFSPWIDMEGYMRKYKVPLFSLETHSPVSEFDILGFSLQYELCYTNVLNMLNLAGIPLRTEERLQGAWPIVIAGGPCAYVPLPLAPFIDVFVIGDGEEAIIEILRLYKKSGKTKKEVFLKELKEKTSGVYVPYYGISGKIEKRIVKDLDKTPDAVRPIVPLIDIVHDRITLEIMRGCPRRCRFCQAGILYKPVRRRSHKRLLDSAIKNIQNTGYEELSLASLSSTDFPRIEKLTEDLLKEFSSRKVSLSLPSMRVDSFSLNLIDRISKVKKTGITLAPEAATDKLLRVINKNYKADDIINVASSAYNMGYRLIKLYFMIGLPKEDYSDLDGIINILNKIGKMGELNVSIATMIPKAHTAFQWEAMLSLDEIKKRQSYIRSHMRSNRIKLKFHKPELSVLEAVFSRPDERLACVIYKAWEQGAKFDQWEECFRYDLWENAFVDCGIDMGDYLSSRDYSASLPWDHIDTGISKEDLIEESKKASELSIELAV